MRGPPTHGLVGWQNVEPKHTGSLVEFVYDVVEKNIDSDDELENEAPEAPGGVLMEGEEQILSDEEMGKQEAGADMVQLGTNRVGLLNF